MFYEINVSLNGHHYFKTAERSLTDKTRAFALAQTFKLTFPANAGYEVTLYSWKPSRKQISI